MLRNAQQMIGLCRTNDPAIAKRWADICIKAEQDKEAWNSSLRAVGVKAAHPNDGWIDREKNEIHFAYPHFNDGAGPGDIVAIGQPFDRPGETRFVCLIKQYDRTFEGFTWWKFKDA